MIEQGTPEWHVFRKNKIGASDAPVIMKKSPWKTPYQLWQEKLCLSESCKTTVAMERGNELEPIARQALEQLLGMPLESKIKLHNQRSWMMASLDAISPDERTVAEIKCPGKDDHLIALSGQVPEKYYPQLQHQMEVCLVERVYYFSYGGEQNALLTVCRDEEYIKHLLKEEEKFFECMQNFEAPEMLDKDFIYQGSARWAHLAERLKEIKKVRIEEETIKKELIELANGQNSMGGGIRLSKCIRKGSVDFSQIEELKNIDLNLYRKKTTEYWRIT
jgi:putative phage-type endonuclease